MADELTHEYRPSWRFVRFNPKRYQRRARAAQVAVTVDEATELMWMSREDIRANICDFGDDPELQAALEAYRTPHIRRPCYEEPDDGE